MTKDTQARHLRVIDSSCTPVCPERTHTINVRGEKISVTFRYGEQTILPFEQGMKFMIDGFRVEEADGTSIVLPTVASDNVTAQLAKDECIAKFNELTVASLKLRAAAKLGGEIYLDAGEDDKANIVAFLIGEPPVADEDSSENAGEIYVDQEDDDEISDEEAALQADRAAFLEKYGMDRADLLIALCEKFGAVKSEYVAEKDEYLLLAADGQGIAQGALDDLIAYEIPAAEPAAEEKKAEEVVEEKQPEPAADAPQFTLNEVTSATDEALTLAVKYGIDVKLVVGTGAKGNVLKGDVEKYIADNALQPVAQA